ncbi:hypothetical protein F4802DRAFT_593083 [Xylaria palmicola]|nr:hypothetical protein F4802DRAFT_593083 [Xylaria palmicola]
MKPFSEKQRRKFEKKTRRLVKRRKRLNQQVLRAAKKTKPSINDWLARKELLQEWARLKMKENRHLEKYTKKLAKLAELYRIDPSSDGAQEYNLVRKLLWDFERSVKPFLDQHITRLNEKSNGDNEDETITSGSVRDSNQSNTDNEDEALRRETPFSQSRRENTTQAGSHSHNGATVEGSVRGTLPQPEAINGTEKPEEAPTNTPSKKVRFALNVCMKDQHSYLEIRNEETGEHMNKKGKQTPVHEAQTNDNTVLSNNMSFPNQSTLENIDDSPLARGPDEQTEARLCLVQIAHPGFEAIDALVYDTGNQPPCSHHEGRFYCKEPYYMSGALLTNPSPDHAIASPSLVSSTNDSRDLIDSRILQASLPQPKDTSFNLSSSPVYLAPKSANVDANNGHRGDSDLSTLSGAHSWNCSDEMSGGHGKTIHAGSPSQAQQSPRWRKTPIPAPQPWRRLGMLTPFSDEPSAPTEHSQSPRPQTTVASKREASAGPSRPRAKARKATTDGPSQPTSESLNGSANSGTRHQRRRQKNKKNKKQ